MKQKVLNWTQRFSTFCFLDNHQYQILPHTLECLLAAGTRRMIKAEPGNALDQLQSMISERPSWLFGHLAYDLKNEIEKLSSNLHTHIQFPGLHFFEPEFLIRLNEKEITIEGEDPAGIYREIESQLIHSPRDLMQAPSIRNRINREEYLSIIGKLKDHILRGDCYEINYCMEFFSEAVDLDPLATYINLSRISPNPFSALYKMGSQWLICASPERFLNKQGKQLLSQPIKGTSKRVAGDEELDLQNKEALASSSKDRSENVMVVDLVRNDLAKVCEEGTVKVDQLYGVYSFPQVHQMISTISGELREGISFTEIIRATFPMGSMTGAPKKRVMELIEHYESSRRGIFSGALGYINPGGDFDFNVIIRSILYNADTGYLSFPAGSGITYYSQPEDEWTECLLKAEAIRKVLTGQKN